MTKEEAVKMISEFENEICNRQLELHMYGKGGPAYHMVEYHEIDKKVQLMKNDILQAIVGKE